MDQRHLRELLTELHRELAAAGSIDGKNQALLQRLAEDIRAIAQTEKADAAEPYQGLRARLVDAAAAFEVTHPRLSKTMENVIDTLAMYNL